MQILELFAGSCSFSNVAKARGHETITTDIIQNPEGTVDIVTDIFDFNYLDLPSIDFIWASPPCTFFSVSSIGHHWNKDHTPKTKEAEFGIKIIEKTIEIIDYIGADFWLIENPRGKLRKLPIMEDLPRNTVTYCQYGDFRMKPTDLWTNLVFWKPKQMCKKGEPCHTAAPRGSRTGTQGMESAYEKSKVPMELCLEIIKVLENEI